MLNIEPEDAGAVDSLHVAVAVIIRDGLVLISKRANHVHQGGLWEFPGGKIEQGETAGTALFREIQEELGINIKKSRPLIKLSHHYPEKNVLLETRLITEFDGKKYSYDVAHSGMEGQVVRWVALEQLSHYKFPAANRAILTAIKLPETYLITPDCSDYSYEQARIQFLQQFSVSIRSNPLVQLRIKSLSGNKLNEMVKMACEIARKNQANLLLNSSLFEGIGSESKQKISGIHLTSQHLYKKSFVASYRKQFPEKIIAASCHNKEDIERANQLRLDFIVISPVQQTASHPQQTALGWNSFAALVDVCKMPAFALGGMNPGDIHLARNSGAQGIAAIRSLWSEEWEDN